MKRFLADYGLAIIPIGTLAVVIAVLLHRASKTEDGNPVFPLDDAYIHMTMAKNFAERGSWSITGEGIQGASSSILWTLLLAGTYAVGGSRELSPLLLNMAFACFSVVVVFVAAQRRGWPKYLTVLVSLGIVLWCPLFTNVMVGMEQSLHVMVMLLLFTCAGELLAKGKKSSPGALPWCVVLLAAMATSVRYESAFLILAICVALALQKRLGLAIAIGLAGASPILGYALFSTQHGGMAAPTSVLTKGVGTSSTFTRIAKFIFVFAFYRLTICPYMIALISTAIVSYLVYRRAKPSAQPTEQADQDTPGLRFSDAGYLFSIWLAATWMFLNATVNDLFYRYDSYLIAMGLFMIGACWAPRLPRKLSLAHWPVRKQSLGEIAMTALTVLLAVVLSWRAAYAAIYTPVASRNIQQQQYQMARFLRDYYPGKAVAINDIGAISYFSKTKLVDIWGLASTKVAKEMLKQSYNSEAMERICNAENVQVAVIYPSWFDNYGGVPKSWVLIGSWTIPDNFVCGNSTVSFFAVDPQQVAALREHLMEFAPKLPKAVKVEYTRGS